MQTPQIGIALDPQSCITFANQHFLEASGYREDELIGRNWFDLFIPEEVRAQVKSVFAQSMESRETAGYSSYENEILTKSGERRFVAWSNVISKDEAGNIIDVTCLGIDLTERRRAEKAVRENEERFQRMLAVVPDMVSIQDTDMHILYSNWQGFGDVPEEKRVRGIKCHKAYRDLDKICPDCRAKRVIETGKPLFEERHLSDGTWVDLRVIPMFDNDGNVEMFMEWVRDISESRSLQEQLTQSQKMESVGRLAGGVAHDFNNMLNVILGHAELTLEDLPEDSPVRESLTEIEKSAKRSADLTRQLLAFARKQTIAPKVIDLNQTVEPMLKMLRRLIGEDIDLEWKPTQSPDRVRIDPSQVDQLLVNLCVNARDAIGKNNGKVTIETSSVAFDEEYCAIHAEFRPGQYVMLAVSDDGCGMDKETRDHIFEPFYTTKQSGLGTGLGLSTVYGIVKQNEAFINVYSEPDEGTSFQLYLPVYHAKPNQATQDTLPVTNQKGGNETLLLVEDEMAILHLAKNALQRQGYHVLAAGTPVEAMAMARDSRKPIDLLLTDVVMPEMNGRELAKQILTLHPEVERLFMSGYTADVIAHHGVLEEGINFIQKPFSPKKLHAKIREILDARIT